MNRVVVVGVQIVLVLLLLISVIFEAFTIPAVFSNVVSQFPEVADLVFPGVLWAVAAVVCGQAILVILWRLVSLTTTERIFSGEAFPWVRAMVSFSWALTALFIVAFIAANVMGFTPPALMFGLIGLSLLGVAFALILVTMHALLRRASTLASEMAEVV